MMHRRTRCSSGTTCASSVGCGTLDAALVLWQSFGFFDAETNRGVLAGLAERLRPGGRLILDLYNRDYWENAAGSDVVTRGGVARITNALDGARLTTVIEYLDSGESDRFDWELYRPSELPDLGAAVGLRCLLMCTECDEQKRPSPSSKALQVVCERER